MFQTYVRNLCALSWPHVVHSSCNDSWLAALYYVRSEALRLQRTLFVFAGQRFCRTRVFTGAELRVGDKRPLHDAVVVRPRDDFDWSSTKSKFLSHFVQFRKMCVFYLCWTQYLVNEKSINLCLCPEVIEQENLTTKTRF